MSISKDLAGAGQFMSGTAAVGAAVLNPIMQWQQNQWNAEQMRQQNQWNIEQWQRENAYNSPAAQMARLRAAGINPALAFSQGQLMNEAAASPAMQASQGEAPQFDVSSLVSAGLSGANYEYLQSLARKNNADALATETKLPEEVVNLQKRNQELDQAIKNMSVQLEEMQAHIRQMDADAQLKAAQRTDISFQQTLASDQFRLKVREVEASIRKMASESELNESLRALNERRLYEDIQSWSYRLLGFDLENQRVRAVTGLTLQQTENARLDGQLLGFDVNRGTLDDMFNRGRIDRVEGKQGKFKQYYSVFKYDLVKSFDMLFSPLKGIISFHN